MFVRTTLFAAAAATLAMSAASVSADTRTLVAKPQPQIMIAHTIKGKGVSFVEADFTFHGRALTTEQAERAREELNATG